MGSKVPGHVDIVLIQSQIESPRIDVPDLADVTGLDNSDNFTYRSRIQECVANHQDEAITLSNFYQFFTLRGRRCHRLFDECMFAGKQARFGQRIVIFDWSGNNHSIYSYAVEQVLKVTHALDVRIEGP